MGNTTKSALRRELRNKYKLDGKPFKKYAPFKAALDRVIADDDESADEAQKKKRSRKRKKPSSDEQDKEAADDEPSKKKRKTNSGESVDVAADADADGEDADDEEESDDDMQRKKRGKHKNKKDKRKKDKKVKKKSKKWSKLDKLRQLLRATRLANPKVYSQLKGLNNDAQRTKFALTLLADKNVPTNDLSIRAIEKIKEEWALKREMEELGLGFGNA